MGQPQSMGLICVEVFYFLTVMIDLQSNLPAQNEGVLEAAWENSRDYLLKKKFKSMNIFDRQSCKKT